MPWKAILLAVLPSLRALASGGGVSEAIPGMVPSSKPRYRRIAGIATSLTLLAMTAFLSVELLDISPVSAGILSPTKEADYQLSLAYLKAIASSNKGNDNYCEIFSDIRPNLENAARLYLEAYNDDHNNLKAQANAAALRIILANGTLACKFGLVNNSSQISIPISRIGEMQDYLESNYIPKLEEARLILDSEHNPLFDDSWLKVSAEQVIFLPQFDLEQILTELKDNPTPSTLTRYRFLTENLLVLSHFLVIYNLDPGNNPLPLLDSPAKTDLNHDNILTPQEYLGGIGKIMAPLQG